MHGIGHDILPIFCTLGEESFLDVRVLRDGISEGLVETAALEVLVVQGSLFL